MASGPDLFVVCRSCGREVSPYITECPYCGNRLRKRAPKLERVLDLAVIGNGTEELWRSVTTLFVYTQTGYELVVLLAVALFGWLLERRHGFWAPLLVFFVAGAGGILLAIAAGDASPVAQG